MRLESAPSYIRWEDRPTRRVKLLPLNCVTLGRLRSLHDDLLDFVVDKEVLRCFVSVSSAVNSEVIVVNGATSVRGWMIEVD